MGLPWQQHGKEIIISLTSYGSQIIKCVSVIAEFFHWDINLFSFTYDFLSNYSLQEVSRYQIFFFQDEKKNDNFFMYHYVTQMFLICLPVLNTKQNKNIIRR